MAVDANQKRIRASLASLTAWEKLTPEQRSAKGRHANAGLWAKFEAEARAEGARTQAEIRAAAKTKHRKHIQRMTYNSLKARKVKAEEREKQAAAMAAARESA
jgi:hypothetical protein